MPRIQQPWESRRVDLLALLVDLIIDLGRGKIPNVTLNLDYVYAHFHRGTRELGDLTLCEALAALRDNVYLWPDAGRENRRTLERGELDLRDADRITLQTH